MTDERIKEIAYKPITEAWKIIHLTQNLKADDTEGWNKYIQQVNKFHEKYSNTAYGSSLETAIYEIVGVISKENIRESQT